MSKEIKNKNLIWTILFMGGPGIILFNLADVSEATSFQRIVLAGILGGLGALIGAGVLKLVKTKTARVKIITMILLAAACFAIVISVDRLNKPVFQTCKICGYYAVRTEQKSCEHCGLMTWPEQKKVKEYESESEWLRDEQLYFFSLDSINQEIDFYEPEVEDGYRKDKNWKPMITQQDLVKDFSLN